MTEQELELQFEEKRKKLRLENMFLEALPSFSKEYNHDVFIHKLYGSNATIKFAHDFYTYGEPKKKQPDLYLLRKLAEKFPPENMFMVRDSCLSFRLAEGVSEQEKQRAEITEVSPFIVKVSGFQQQSMTVEWYTKVSNVLVEINIVFPLLSLKFGNLTVRYQDYMGGRRVKECSLTLNNKLSNLNGALAERPIKWGRGSEDVPNDFTVYWLPVGQHKARLEDLVEALK